VIHHRHLLATGACLAALSPVLLAASAPAAWSAGAEAPEYRLTGPDGTPGGPHAPRAHGRSHCKPSIEVSSHEVAAGETVAVSGTIACGEGEELAGELVTLYEHTRGSRGVQPVAETTTAADGSYQMASPPLEQRSVFLVRADRARSARVRVSVTAHVSFNVAATGDAPAAPDLPRSFAGHRAVTFTGAVTVNGINLFAVLQRERPAGSGKWRRIAVAPVTPVGTYSITHSFGRPGEAVLRVLVRGRGALVAKSDPASFQILPRDRRRAAIEPSAPGA
jgi:hypothetical protein